MKTLKKLSLSITLIVFSLIILTGCDSEKLLSGNQNIQENSKKELSSPGIERIKILQIAGGTNSLGKVISEQKFITSNSGGLLSISNGDPDGTLVNSMYALNGEAPHNVYRINPENPSSPTLVGQLGFLSYGFALHPFNGKVYYVSAESIDGTYPVGVWDPETNSNTTLPQGSTFRPNGKLAFHPDGRLFGSEYGSTRKVYTINTETGEWTFHALLNKFLMNDGDMIFSPDGSTMYSTGGINPKLKITDVSNGFTTNLAAIGAETISGLFLGRNGYLYGTNKTGSLGIINTTTGAGRLIGETGLPLIHDLAPVIASTELAFVEMSLNILPGALSGDSDISLNVETTELSGGVAVTFEPHGTIFNQPAILNIEALGVDFSGINPNEVEIYYDNQESGLWEPIPREELIINAETGYIKVVDAQLPHFSRYAIGLNP